MKKLLIILLMGMFLVSFVGAAVLPMKSFDDKVGDYGEITIYNWNVIGKIFDLKLAELELKTNTDTCGSSCSAETEIVMYQRGSLIDDVKFMTLQEDESWIKQDIRSYQFYIKTNEEQYDVDNFEYQCKEREVYSAINDTTYTESYDCKNVKVGTHKEKEPLWEEYTLGTEVETGTYEIKLEGEKKPSRTVDWQITSQGKLIDEWAVWGNISEGDDAEVLLNSPENNYESLTFSVDFNCSANVTGGATVANISLWHNGTGTWERNQTVNYGSFPSSLKTDLQSYWKLDESSGSVLDAVGSNDGTNNGAEAGYSGLINTAYNFVPNDYIDLGTDLEFNSGSFTIQAWINTSINTGGMGYIFVKDTGKSGGQELSLYAGSGYIRYSVGRGTSIQYNGNYYDEDWHQIIITRNATHVNMWFDTVFIGAGSIGAESSAGSTKIGRRDNGYGFWGAIDEIGYWDVELTQSQIEDLYNSGVGIEYSLLTTNATNVFTTTITDPTLWTCEACDSDGDCGFALTNRTVNIDSTAPVITITAPIAEIYHRGGDNLSLNWTIDETTGTCWYEYQGTNTTVTCADLNASFMANDFNNKTIMLWANDSVGNTANISSTWTYNLWEDSQTYDPSVTEGSTGNFTALINYTSSNWNLITASIWYNNTEYSGSKLGSGDNIEFYKGVSAPDVSGSTEVGFNWRIGLTNSTGTFYYNLTNYTQTVNTVNVSYCGVTYSTPFMNFTFYDEETLEKVNGTIDLTFNYRASTSPTTFNDVFSYTNHSADVQSHQFCFDPVDETFTVDAIISYTSPTYTHRFYNFEGIEFTNTTTEIGLYLINDSDSTSFIIEILDNNYYPISEAEVYVQRYYASTNTWRTLEILETNDDGETIQHLFTEDVLYRFKVYNDGTLLHTTSQSTIACKETPCTITIIIPTSIDDIYEPTGNLETSLTMDANYLISYTYTDTSGDFSSSRLHVIRNNPGIISLEPVCNSTSSTATAVLTCDLFSERNGTYIAKGFITRNGDSELNVERKVFYKTRDIIAGIGLDGLLWSIFFLIGIVMLGIYRPSMAIIFAIVGVFLLSLLQLMEISITAIVAIIGIGIVLLVGVKNQ